MCFMYKYFNSCLTENTECFYHENQSVNEAQGNISYLF